MKRAWDRENKKIRRSKSAICLKEVQDLENACDVGVNPRGSAWIRVEKQQGSEEESKTRC